MNFYKFLLVLVFIYNKVSLYLRKKKEKKRKDCNKKLDYITPMDRTIHDYIRI